jgi:hypothetical protein
MKTLEDYHNALPYRKTNDEKIGNLLVKMLEFYGLKDKFMEVRVKNYWHEQMGPTISEFTKNIFVKNKKLFIQLSATSLRQELSYAKDKIKKMMNDLLDEEYLEDVILV